MIEQALTNHQDALGKVDQALRVAALERSIILDILTQKVVSQEFVRSAMKSRAPTYGLSYEDPTEEGSDGQQASGEQDQDSVDIPGTDEPRRSSEYSD